MKITVKKTIKEYSLTVTVEANSVDLLWSLLDRTLTLLSEQES